MTDAAERYVFRPGVLRSFGWRVLDIPGKDWMHDRDAVLMRIESMLADGEDRALDSGVEPLSTVPAKPKPAASVSPGTGEIGMRPEDEPKIELVRDLRFEGGTSHKFWRATLRGAELSVSYGRIGSTGQTNLKQFESEERARREMHKLVTEKLNKGYVEVSSPPAIGRGKEGSNSGP